MIDVSLETANRFYTLGWTASLTGAAVTFVGVVFLMWGTRVRDHDFEESIGVLHESAATAEKQSKELTEGNLNLQKDLEREKSERTKLEIALEERKNRKITDGQKAAIIERLKPLPKGKIIFNPLMGDGEAFQFSDQIQSVLKEAGYPVEEVPLKDRLMMLNRTGVFLWMKDAHNPPERAKNIATAFRLVGITIWGDSNSDFTDPDEVMLVVSTHP